MKYLILGILISGYLCVAVDLIAEDKPVAKVGEYTILFSQFMDKYKPIGNDDIDSLKQSVIDNLISDKLMFIDACNKGLDKEIEEQLRPDLNRAIVGKLYDQVVVKKTKVSPWSVRNEWWHRGIVLKLSQIVVKDRNVIPDIYGEFRKGTDFGDVARKYSTDFQGKYGGEMGEIRWGQLEPKLQRVAFSLKQGEVSPPIKIRDEYRIFKLNTSKEVRRDFSKEKESIEGSLKSKKQGELANKYLDYLRKTAHPKYNLKVIDEVIKSPDSVNKKKIIMSWVGGDITVDYFLSKADRELKMGQLNSPDAVKNWLSSHLTYEILLPLAAMRYRFDRLPDIKQQLNARKEMLVLQEYQNKEIDGKMTDVTDEEVKAFFEANRDIYGGKKAKFEQVQSRVRWDCEREKREARRGELIKELQSKIDIEIFWDNLKEL